MSKQGVHLGMTEAQKLALGPQTDKRAEYIVGKFARAFSSCQEPNCPAAANYFVEGEEFCREHAGKQALIILQMERRATSEVVRLTAWLERIDSCTGNTQPGLYARLALDGSPSDTTPLSGIYSEHATLARTAAHEAEGDE